MMIDIQRRQNQFEHEQISTVNALFMIFLFFLFRMNKIIFQMKLVKDKKNREKHFIENLKKYNYSKSK